MSDSTLPVGGHVVGKKLKKGLAPGKGLQNWVTLTKENPGLVKDPKLPLQDITLEELAKHKKIKDCWMAIRGKVYDVTPYMDYHPGGEEELMRGAGIDATNLFIENHAWVNIDSLLKTCYIGNLVRPSIPADLFKSDKRL